MAQGLPVKIPQSVRLMVLAITFTNISPGLGRGCGHSWICMASGLQ